MTEKRAKKQIVGGKDVEAGKLEMHSLVSNKSQNVNRETEEIDESNFFSLKSSILALWVPCVIGKTKYSFLLISLTSFAVRTLAFLLSLLLAYWNILPSEHFFYIVCQS